MLQFFFPLKKTTHHNLFLPFFARRLFSAAAAPSLQTPGIKLFSNSLGHVKVEFALETARVRLHLPFKGETWFFVDNKTTLKDFAERC